MRDDMPYTIHTNSIEDLQFSPFDDFAFASCFNFYLNYFKYFLKFYSCNFNNIKYSILIFIKGSSDKSIKLTDLRTGIKNKPHLEINNAHSSDVNVINWSTFNQYLLCSGGDDGYFKIWDLRYL